MNSTETADNVQCGYSPSPNCRELYLFSGQTLYVFNITDYDFSNTKINGTNRKKLVKCYGMKFPRYSKFKTAFLCRFTL